MDSSEGHLRKPSQSPHGSPALAGEPRPRPGPCSFGKTLTHPELALKLPPRPLLRPQGPALILESVLRSNPLPRLPHPKPPQ